MNVWTAVALSRPDCLADVLANHARQSTPSQLLIVENGRAIGCAKGQADVVLESGGNQCQTRNAAIEYLRGDTDAYLLFWDDDDYYAEGYTAEHVALAERGKLVGKRTHWVDFLGEEMCLFSPSLANQPAPWVRGGTIGGFASEMPLFPEVACSEEIEFARAFIAQGGRVWASSIHHSAYVRRRDTLTHCYPATRMAFEHQQGVIKARARTGDYSVLTPHS